MARDPGYPVRRRSPMLALFLSGLFPGLGQLYNREKRKAALFAVGGVLAGFGPLSPLDVSIDPSDLTRGLQKLLLASLPFTVLCLWSIVDAYRVARRAELASVA